MVAKRKYELQCLSQRKSQSHLITKNMQNQPYINQSTLSTAELGTKPLEEAVDGGQCCSACLAYIDLGFYSAAMVWACSHSHPYMGRCLPVAQAGDGGPWRKEVHLKGRLEPFHLSLCFQVGYINLSNSASLWSAPLQAQNQSPKSSKNISQNKLFSLCLRSFATVIKCWVFLHKENTNHIKLGLFWLGVACNSQIGRLRQEGYCEFKASLNYMVRPCFKNKKQTKNWELLNQTDWIPLAFGMD